MVTIFKFYNSGPFSVQRELMTVVAVGGGDEAASRVGDGLGVDT